jgi:hypothetical protein
MVALRVLLCGRWCLLVSCGTCGRNEMIVISKTKKDPLMSSSLSFFTLCIHGQLLT